MLKSYDSSGFSHVVQSDSSVSGVRLKGEFWSLLPEHESVAS